MRIWPIASSLAARERGIARPAPRIPAGQETRHEPLDLARLAGVQLDL